MQDRSKVVKFKKRRSINFGVVIFVIILVYTILNIYLLLTTPQISIYEVVEQGLAQDNIVTGIITREETVVTTPNSGYLNYYFRDNVKVSKNSTIYSIDESKRIYDKLSDMGGEVGLSDKDVKSIKQTILKYKKYYDDSSYSDIYDFRDDLSATMREVIDANLLENMQSISSNTGISTTFAVSKCDIPGVLSYYSDTYDGLKETGISAAVFNQDSYQRKSLRSSDLVEAGQPVYKLITDDNWVITALISETIADTLKEKTQLTFTVLSDGLQIKAPISIFKNGEDWYLRIALDKYVVHYSKERFLDLQLNLNNESGLKIPQSSIIEKEFYMIPVEYFTKGGDSNNLGLMVEKYDEKTSQIIPAFTECEIYYQDEMYAYVDTSSFVFGNFVQNVTNNERFQISLVGKLQGVYNVNKGYAVFRRIEKLDENDEYVIIKKGSAKGVSLYDHIALNASLITDSSIIY